MNVLQLSKYYPPYRGGLEYVARIFSKAHVDCGDKVFIVSFGSGNKTYSGQYGEQVTQVNRDIFLLSTPFHFRLVFRFLRYIDKNKIDKIYVHLHNPFMHQLIWLFHKSLKKKGIIISAIYHSDLANHKKLGPLYYYFFLKTSSFYDEVICSSEKLWNSSPVLTKFPDRVKRIIPFCGDGSNRFKLRSAFNGKLLAIGRLVPYKGFQFLVETISQTPHQLTIIGTGPLEKKLRALSKDNIIFKGEVSDQEKKNLVEQSDLLIVSSINRSEAYGIIIVEAFESGLPVIASNIESGVTYLVKEGERGKIFNYGSQQELLDCIQYYQQNPQFISEVSQNVRTFYEKFLSYTKFKENIKQLIRVDRGEA